MTAATTTPTPVDRARDFAAELRERAPAIEDARRLPRDLSDRFAQAGFYRMCVPSALGGLECPPATTMETIETLARADGASAWCVFIGATSGSVLSLLSEAAGREIFARETTLLSGVFAPRGAATAVDGGFRISGRWPWGSGTQNADWILAGCRVVREGAPAAADAHAPETRLMIVPASSVEFLDTWHVSGLSGTGSTDFEIRDVFVPASRAVAFGVDRALPRPLYAFPQFGLLALGIGAVALGLARAAIDELVALAATKTPDGSGRPLAARPAAQSEVALAEATLRSARAFYREAIATAWEAAMRDGAIDVTHRRDLRLATTHATQASAAVVGRMYTLAGGSAVYRSSPLQRIFRDVHVATQHMMVSPSTLELTGRLLLGLETDTAML
ncbi:MAG: acyl-CoA dehydrogenase family protein [Myxococcota bacterium]